MPSFDVVSSPDLQEIDNAINNTKREVDNRFDFKNTNSTIERSEYSITIETTDNTRLNQFNDILKNNIVRRKVDPKFIHVKSTETASGNRVRQFVDILNGISKEDAKKIIADIKKLKLKIQIKIQGEELRVDGKKRDDLQEAIAAIKAIDIGQPIDFVNFRD